MRESIDLDQDEVEGQKAVQLLGLLGEMKRADRVQKWLELTQERGQGSEVRKQLMAAMRVRRPAFDAALLKIGGELAKTIKRFAKEHSNLGTVDPAQGGDEQGDESGGVGGGHVAARQVAELGDPDAVVEPRLRIRVDDRGSHVTRDPENLMEILASDARLQGLLWRDLRTSSTMWRDRPILDTDVQGLRAWVGLVYSVSFSILEMHAAVEATATLNGRNPIADYIEALPAWDGVERIKHLFLDYFGCEAGDGEQGYYQEAGYCFMVALIARAMDPGCKHDSMPILVGRKGLRKSTGCKVLVPDPAWFGDSTLSFGDKAAYENIQGVLLWELAELDSLRRAEISAFKAFMTSDKDTFRPAYGRYKVIRPRLTCFIATVNPEDDPLFLLVTDRRFWPLQCKRVVDVDRIEEDRAQLWAEAFYEYVNRPGGAPNWFLSRAADQVRESSSEEYVTESPLFEAVQKFCEDRVREIVYRPFNCFDLVASITGKRHEEVTRTEQMEAAKLLRGLGFKTRQHKLGTRGIGRWYYPQAKSVEE